MEGQGTGIVERLTRQRELEACRADWDALYEASGESNLFLTWEWLDNWVYAFERPFVALLRRGAPGGPLEAALLLDASEPGRWCTVSSHSYRAGVLHRPGLVTPWRPFLRHAALHARQIRRIVLHRCPDTPAFRAGLAGALGPLRGLVVEHHANVSRLVDTSTSFEAYLASRAKKVRHELRRKEKALARALPDVRLVELPREAGGAGALEVIEQVEGDSWKLATETAIVCHQRERAFYGGCFELRSERTQGRLFALRGVRGPIAFVIGVQHDDTFYALKTSYRADHAALSPGQVLFARLIERLCEEAGVRHLELLGSDSRWKRELASSQRDERTFEIVRPSLAGLGYVAALNHVRPALRRAAARDARVARVVDTLKHLGRRLRGAPPGEGEEGGGASPGPAAPAAAVETTDTTTGTGRTS